MNARMLRRARVLWSSGDRRSTGTISGLGSAPSAAWVAAGCWRCP
jgi:hypothetical protein